MADQPADDQRERELKFDVPDAWELPDPTSLVPATGTIERDTVQLETVYYDTAARDLLAARLALRRRTGDTDTGWQLKVPDGNARIEIRLPLTGRGVPEQLRAMTLGARCGSALKPIATLTTRRTVCRLVDGVGTATAEIVVDEVTATSAEPAAEPSQWREVEVELINGDEALLADVARWLQDSGARPASSASKLARALEAKSPRAPDTRDLTGLVRTYLDAQYEEILRGDIDLRRGRDAIHDTRVATRRYRSVLRVFADVLDAPRAAALDGELKWFASAMGEVRDRQVLRVHLDDALAALPPELVLGPVAARIDQTLAAEQAQAEADLERVMRGQRYFALQRELRAWLDDPPIADQRPAGDVERFLHKAERTVRRRLRRAPHTADPDAAMHRARKAAKRTRYAAELGVPHLGRPAVKMTERAKKLQRELGERQDSVVAAEFLLRVGAIAGTTVGENGFTFGLLYAEELDRAHHTGT